MAPAMRVPPSSIRWWTTGTIEFLPAEGLIAAPANNGGDRAGARRASGTPLLSESVANPTLLIFGAVNRPIRRNRIRRATSKALPFSLNRFAPQLISSASLDSYCHVIDERYCAALG
jgi:hypothetical protein